MFFHNHLKKVSTTTTKYFYQNGDRYPMSDVMINDGK